jgi:hypothetical protein
MKPKKPESWSNVKASVSSMDRAGLVGVIRDRYESSRANRRFLRARFVPAAATLDEYRHLVASAVFPDPLSHGPIRLRDAAAAISDYKRSTGISRPWNGSWTKPPRCSISCRTTRASRRRLASFALGDTRSGSDGVTVTIWPRPRLACDGARANRPAWLVDPRPDQHVERRRLTAP